MTVNRYCASGLETISIAVAKIRAGMGHIYVAGGTENMSVIPMTGYKLAPAYKVANENPNYMVGMGITAEAVGKKYGISREQSDEFSYHSHIKAANAIDEGKFKDEIVPVTVEDVFVKDNKRSPPNIPWIRMKASAGKPPWKPFQNYALYLHKAELLPQEIPPKPLTERHLCL